MSDNVIALPRYRSPYTGHRLDCAAYETIDESDCTCDVPVCELCRLRESANGRPDWEYDAQHLAHLVDGQVLAVCDAHLDALGDDGRVLHVTDAEDLP